MNRKPDIAVHTAALRRHAKARLRRGPAHSPSRPGVPRTEADLQRLLHELQVHQIELELQNTELQDARNRMEILLDKYTDLYDFAPVGYFSLDEQGRIIEANLTGAALLGVERSRLLNRPLGQFAAAASQLAIAAFLERIFSGAGKQVCEASLLRRNARAFWASFHGSSTHSSSGTGKWCRVAISDITLLKQAEEAQRRMEVLAVVNRELRREIVQRQTVEKALKKSEHHSGKLLEQSRQMQERLRLLSRQVLSAQEEERKKISRELHDVIAQTLTNINVRLANLKKEAGLGSKGLEASITRTQRLVAQSVGTVHHFARELRPTVLDDLGLIPALHTFIKVFQKETGVRVSLSACAAVEQVMGDQRTALYRVAQEALTNVARHANATRVQVRIQKLNGTVSMEIEDNGKGFRNKLPISASKGKRLGLLGMRERVEMIGGTFSIKTAPNQGTAIQALIPFSVAGRQPKNS